MLTALALASLAQQTPKVPAGPPRLVVMVVVDQLIPEQLRRLEPELDGGFGRFLREGTVFWNATVDYSSTETGPGHATLATGRYPSSHGIVANQFFDRATNAEIYCVGDKGAHPMNDKGVDAASAGVSPANLRGDALGDLIQAAQGASKTVAIAGKDRSAVLLGGRQPDAALWWDNQRGGFVSSSYYGEKLPAFAGTWGATWAERARGWEWTLEVKGDLARLGTAPDDRAGEVSRYGRTLPRRLPEKDEELGGAVFSSPLVDYFTLELATLALESLDLGRDDAVDFLGLSLSGCDAVGHAHGPDSVEVTDLLVRADHELGRLFAALDEKVGAGRWIACLSSDHGVLDLPESLSARAVGARRIGMGELAELRKGVDEEVALLDAGGADLKLVLTEQGYVFDEAAVTAAGLEPATLREAIATAAERSPIVAEAYTLDELRAEKPVDPWASLYARSMAEQRYPDVALRLQPWTLLGLPMGTSHGSPYPYDRRVPLAFLGPKVAHRARFDAASPTDAVPTLLALLGITPKDKLDGRALTLD